MSTAVIEVQAMVDKSMEMKLPMTVKLHEVPILRAVYGQNAVRVDHFRATDEMIDPNTEMDRLVSTYGINSAKQPWAEAIYGQYGAGVQALAALYEDDAAAVRDDLLGDATPYPDTFSAFQHPVTLATVVPNLGDIGTSQDQRPEAQHGKAAANKKAIKKAPTTN